MSHRQAHLFRCHGIGEDGIEQRLGDDPWLLRRAIEYLTHGLSGPRKGADGRFDVADPGPIEPRIAVLDLSDPRDDTPRPTVPPHPSEHAFL